MSDEALVAGAKMGRGSVFDELHERHHKRMFRVAHRITRHRENAQDAVQESLLSAPFEQEETVRSQLASDMMQEATHRSHRISWWG